MADYVLLEGSPKNNQIRVVVHTTVPNGNNQAGTPWGQALVGSLESTVSRVPPSFLPVGRQAELDAGSVYEWEFSFEDDANANANSRVTNLESEIVAREAAESARMQNRLRYFGRTGSV